MDAADAKQADRGAKAPWSWPPRLNRSMEILAGLLVALSAFGAGRGQTERSASAMERSRARAETSIDVSTRRCEARLRGYMQAIIDEATGRVAG